MITYILRGPLFQLNNKKFEIGIFVFQGFCQLFWILSKPKRFGHKKQGHSLIFWTWFVINYLYAIRRIELKLALAEIKVFMK